MNERNGDVRLGGSRCGWHVRTTDRIPGIPVLCTQDQGNDEFLAEGVGGWSGWHVSSWEWWWRSSFRLSFLSLPDITPSAYCSRRLMGAMRYSQQVPDGNRGRYG